ncbi:MAG: aminotransferase class III-fold pyridoxal phosphate-dependent enzyme [Myxococcales bacterium]|nr:aminotransferase class III-fold pyridoxal phosphate-dependent enzyme [Myxococcales bacterium]MCB9705669.1 aminotransferase class III-fold pyridoxal phosphate-dependent enzyme [Myxococcales bacterium]
MNRQPPDRDLDLLLAELETRQRGEAPRPGALVERETQRVRIPVGGELPRSAALLDRIYAGDFVAREKKPMVVDTRRSWGPYMVSVDPHPLVILDACSQIATLTHGFAHPGIIKALYDGRFHACLWSNPDTAVHHAPEVAEYAEALRRVGPPSLDHVAFVGAGGAEANEKALRIARLHAPPPVGGVARKRVLAFRDGFHGRTLSTLMATWNPAKRGPFEIAGYEAIFAETNLASVQRALDEHHAELYAVIVEPMMAEGGDVHLGRQFLLGLLQAVRARKLPLIVDEVQTGFATGGPFFWWQRLGLGGDKATSPDLMTCAKKANLGVVLSRWPDPEVNQISVASALRGLIQLESAHEQGHLEAMLQKRVKALAAAFPEIGKPRVAGTTFAFDLADNAQQNAFINQRYQRGFMTYGAGSSTIRFRLSASWGRRHLDDLFARVSEDLSRLQDPSATAWPSEAPNHKKHHDFDIREVEEGDWPAILEIENASYEAARRDSLEYLRGSAEAGLGLVAVDRASRAILGFCFGGPVEHYSGVSGPAQDDRFGLHDSFYSADITVSAAARSRGIGRALKRAQVRWAARQGFRFITGRNRVGATGSMAALNASFGAFHVVRLERQYEGNAQADYYRIPLGPPPDPPARELATEQRVDLASGLQQPFGPAPRFMAARELVGPVASRLNLSNYATIDVVHYIEHLRLLAPRGTAHAYFTSSRDETVDKSLRCLRLSRPDAQIAVGLDGGYVGHVTAAARSISDPAGFGPDFGFFPWPRLPHPAIAGVEATIAALDALVAEVGAGRLFGLFAEVIGERSGLVLEGEAAAALADACRRHDLPLCLVETASGTYRGGAGAWGVDRLPASVRPDLVLWYPGGQLGHIFASDRYYIAKPLTLISTWDGDELSMIRVHEHLRAARHLTSIPAAADALAELLRRSLVERFPGASLGGAGLYRTVSFPDPAVATAIQHVCSRRGLFFGVGRPGTLIAAPPLDVQGPSLVTTVRSMLDPLIDDIAARGIG